MAAVSQSPRGRPRHRLWRGRRPADRLVHRPPCRWTDRGRPGHPWAAGQRGVRGDRLRLRPARTGKGTGTATVAALAGCLATVPGTRQVTAVTGAQNTPSRARSNARDSSSPARFRPVRPDTHSALANQLPACPPQPDLPNSAVCTGACLCACAHMYSKFREWAGAVTTGASAPSS
jgi:hypothetical protein